MRGTCYPIEFFYQELPKMGFDDIEISIIAPKSNNDPHPFVFARKEAGGFYQCVVGAVLMDGGRSPAS
jgi:hypothetical protein